MNAVKVEEKPKLFVLFARMWGKGSAYRQSLAPRVLLMNAVKVEEWPSLAPTILMPPSLMYVCIVWRQAVDTFFYFHCIRRLISRCLRLSVG